MTAFRVGMKVCCVDDGWGYSCFYRDGTPSTDRYSRVPMLREVLTVKEMGSLYGQDWLQFQEIEGGWASSHFRPIVSRPTSIAVFQAMLTGKKAGVEA